MEKIIKSEKNISRTTLMSSVAMLAMFATLFLGVGSASAVITSQLDLGDRGEDVSELQTYLSTNPSLYPSGLVTGYFWTLTEAGVQKFQAMQGIVSQGTPTTTGYGRVGPQTMAKLNSLLGSGYVGPISMDMPPMLSAVSVSKSATTATFSWSTNEPTHAHVYYDTSPLRADEATGPKQIPYVSGMAALDEGSYQTSHAITVQNLQPNTTYYYLVRSIDTVRGMSMTWPATFRTD